MCSCDNACGCGVNTSVLPQGEQGDDGAQGLFGGFSAEWAFSTSTSTGPTSTQLRFNNSTYSSVTAIYVSDTGTGTLDMDAFLDSISNNSKYGYIRIFKEDDSTKFWMGQVTAVVDNGTDHTLTVTHIQSNSTFTNADAVVLTFSPAGFADTVILNNNTTQVTTTNAAMTALMTYTYAANKFSTNGDVSEVIAVIDTNGTTESKAAEIRLGGSVAHTKVTEFVMPAGAKYMKIELRITRQTATTLFLEYQVVITGDKYQVSSGYALFETGFSVSDLSVNTLLLEVRGRNVAAGTQTIAQNQLLIDFFKKP